MITNSIRRYLDHWYAHGHGSTSPLRTPETEGNCTSPTCLTAPDIQGQACTETFCFLLTFEAKTRTRRQYGTKGQGGCQTPPSSIAGPGINTAPCNHSSKRHEGSHETVLSRAPTTLQSRSYSIRLGDKSYRYGGLVRKGTRGYPY